MLALRKNYTNMPNLNSQGAPQNHTTCTTLSQAESKAHSRICDVSSAFCCCSYKEGVLTKHLTVVDIWYAYYWSKAYALPVAALAVEATENGKQLPAAAVVPVPDCVYGPVQSTPIQLVYILQKVRHSSSVSKIVFCNCVFT